MDNVMLNAFVQELEKISAAHNVSGRFELEKVSSKADILEKMAALELAHRYGEISDQEKEAGMNLLKGAWGAMRGGAGAARTALPQLGSRMGQAYSGAASQAMSRGAGRMGQVAQGALGATKALGRGLPGAARSIGAGMKGGFGTAYNAANAASATNRAGSSLNKVIGGAAVAAPIAAYGGYSMGQNTQPQGY